MEVKVKTKFYNNNFLLAMKCAGYNSILQFCNENGSAFCYQTIWGYINFISYPKEKKRIKRLVGLLNVPEEYLFPPEYKLAVDKKYGKSIKAIKEVSLKQIEQSSYSGQEELLRVTDQSEKIQSALDKLEPRQRFIIEKRFGLGENPETLSLRKVGKVLDVGPERVRQIEAKALRILRHPRIAKTLRDQDIALPDVESED